MQSLASSRHQARAVAAPSCTRAGRSAVLVRCSSSPSQQPSRREAVMGAAALVLVSPLMVPSTSKAEQVFSYKLLPVDKLGAFQIQDQRKEYIARAEATLKKYLTGADAPGCVRLALLDAGDYDSATKTGGMNGSAIKSAPSSLSGIISKLKEAKQDIDAGDKTGAGPISWADLIYLAGKVSSQKLWFETKVAAAGEAAVISSGSAWPAVIGRVDSDVAGPNTVPSADAPVEEIRSYLLKLGAKPGDGGPFSAKPPFWENPGFLIWTAGAADPAAEEARFAAASETFAGIKRKYDLSRNTISRSDYEIDFAAAYNKLTMLGATVDPVKYLYPQPVLNAKL